jgi:D-inositol-3-phosphate glycosyltransferase
VRDPGARRLKAAVIEPVGGHGGMVHYDAGLCEGLAEAGVDVTLYTSDKTPEDERAPYRTRRFYREVYGPDPAWRRGIRYLRASLRAMLGAGRDGASVAHLHFFHAGPLELFDVLLARLLGLRVVATAHDVRPFAAGLSAPRVAKVAYRLVHRIVAHSETARRELLEVLRVPGAKVDVIPHGNYLRSIDGVPTKEAARSRLGLDRDARVLLFFGQLKEVKGLDVLLRAMPKVVDDHEDAVLLIAGKVWKDDWERYRRQADALAAAGNCVCRVSYVPEAEVPDYYAASDVVVLPYHRIYQSGVLLLAMSYGKPVVVSDIEGMTEVVEDGANGHVFSSGDDRALAEKLSQVLADPAGLKRVGEAGLAYVSRHHDWSETGRKTAEAYRGVRRRG